jgi:hypothetical protein
MVLTTFYTPQKLNNMNEEIQTWKCSSCSVEYTENDFEAINLKGESLCESCESSAWDYPCTTIVTQNGTTTSYIWCEDFGYRDREYFEDAELDSVTGFKYVRTDGWRGYWDAVIGEGYTTLANGWATGSWSDVPWKHKFNDLIESIQKGELECPYELVFGFGLTSNVFSTSVDVVIKEKNIKKFTEWLEQEAGITLSDLEDSLR